MKACAVFSDCTDPDNGFRKLQFEENIMEILKIAVLALLAGVMALIIKQKQPEMAKQVTLACGLIILIYTLSYLGGLITFFEDTITRFSLPSVSLTAVMKIIGIAYLCEFTSQSLKDMEENALAQKVELSGRVVIVILTVPMFNTFTQLILNLSSGI